MLPPHLRKFSSLYAAFGLGAEKNIWLITCLIPLARTANLYKMKDYVGTTLNRKDTQPASNYKRLTRFFQDWSNNKKMLENLMRLNLSILRGRGFNTLILDGTSWTIVQTKVHYLVLAMLVGKVAVPIYWEQLKKLEASSQDERESILKAALQLFNLQGMTLLPDRECNREVSILRDGPAILINKCQDFLSFIQYLLSVFSSKNHRFCKNVQ